MKICEDCMKQDVCKYKKEIEEYIGKGFHYSVFNVPKPLKTNLYCELKVAEEKPIVNWGTDTTYWHPDQCTYTSADTYILASN